MARTSNLPLDQCPTCLNKREDLEGYDGLTAKGVYKFRGYTYDCDCEMQMLLRRHYLAANIPDEYQRLDFNDYDNDEVKEVVTGYVSNFVHFKLNGMGLEFFGKMLGTGKTFMATYVGKELIKQGENVFFTSFREVLSSYEKSNREELEARLREASVLILDEVIPPWTQAQRQFFAEHFETLVRHRTNFNLPTIMTTNIEPEELAEIYPRSYSLLDAKQLRIEMAGNDARQGQIAKENLELALNGEVRPIT